jgi:hypothetical protein
VIRRLLAGLLVATLGAVLPAGCGRHDVAQRAWVEDEVSFVDDGLTLHGTYRHLAGDGAGPAALLISESGVTDRNGDNNVAGAIGNMRQLAEFLSDQGVATLRYDKVGTGATGLGPFTDRPTDLGSAVNTAGAKAAVRFLTGQSATDAGRISVYALGEGAVHAMSLAGDNSPGAPRIHSLGLLQPLSARYLDLIGSRVSADVSAAVRTGTKTQQQADRVLAAWQSAVTQVRTTGSAPKSLPDGLGAILNPGNAKAVAEADAIDPAQLAARVPAGTPVLLTCSDTDGQATCTGMAALTRALAHTDLEVLELKGVNHVLRDDPTDNVANYAKPGPLSPQLTQALSRFAAE